MPAGFGPITATDLVTAADDPYYNPLNACCGLLWYVCASLAWLACLYPSALDDQGLALQTLLRVIIAADAAHGIARCLCPIHVPLCDRWWELRPEALPHRAPPARPSGGWRGGSTASQVRSFFGAFPPSAGRAAATGT